MLRLRLPARVLVLVSLLGLAGLATRLFAASPFASAIQEDVSNQEKLFADTVEAMPEEKFSFTPESLKLPGAEFAGARSFAMQVKHVAADNYAIWAPLTGKPEPQGIDAPNGPAAMVSRQQILQFLKDSFAYSHAAAGTLTAENALELVDFRGQKVTRISLVLLAATHMSDHYGQIVEYLRLCGVVPPASRPRVAVPR